MWSGQERRKERVHMEMLPECKIMLEAIDKNFKENNDFRKALTQNLFMIVLTIILQIGSFLYLWGRINLQVEINTGRLTFIEALFPRSLMEEKKHGE